LSHTELKNVGYTLKDTAQHILIEQNFSQQSYKTKQFWIQF